MKKFFNVLMALLIAFFTLPFGGKTTFAEVKVYDNIPNGEYEIDIVALKIDSDESSIMSSFIEDKAILTVENDKVYLGVTLTSQNLITFFQIEGQDAVETHIDPEQDTRFEKFEIDNLEPILNAQVKYYIPGVINGDHMLRLSLEGLDELVEEESENPDTPDPEEPADPEDPETPEPEEPEEPEAPVDPENPGEEEEETEDPEAPENGDGDDSDETGNNDESSNEEDQDSDENGDNADDESEQSFLGLDDGTYHVGVSYLRSDNDNPSAMGRYLGDIAFVIVNDGQAEVTFTINNHETVTKLLIEDQSSTVAKLDERNLDETSRYETFKLDAHDSIVNAYVEYQAPFGDSIHYGKADFRIVFDEENIAEATADEQPGYDIEEELILLDDGFYTIEANYLRDDDPKTPSSMANYLDSNAFVSVVEGKTYLTITVNDDQTVTKLQVNGADAVEAIVDGEKRYETFELEDLMSLMNAFVEYQVLSDDGDVVWESEAGFLISLNSDSIETAEESDHPAYGVVIEDPKQPEPEDPKEDPEQKENDEVEGSDEVAGQLIPETVYEIHYEILHEDGDQVSVADPFFDKPGHLLVKDGIYYVQMLITNADMIQELKNAYGDALLVEAYGDGSALVQFKVNEDLSMMTLDMHVIVPPMPGFPGYDEDHKALLVFDQDSMTEVSSKGYVLAASNNPENENGPYIEDAETPELGDGTPEKPEFGSADDTDEDDDEKTGNTNDDSTDNPQTGDSNNILLYSLLLVGSLIPLGVQAIRRRIA